MVFRWFNKNDWTFMGCFIWMRCIEKFIIGYVKFEMWCLMSQLLVGCRLFEIQDYFDFILVLSGALVFHKAILKNMNYLILFINVDSMSFCCIDLNSFQNWDNELFDDVIVVSRLLPLQNTRVAEITSVICLFHLLKRLKRIVIWLR